MNASEYQTEAARTLIANDAMPAFPPRDVAVAWGLVEMARRLGLEIDAVKKDVFHQHGYDQQSEGRTLDRVQLVAAIGAAMEPLLAERPSARWQVEAARSLRPFDTRLLWNTMGVLGEGAEIANLVLTVLESGDFDKAALAKEIGDLCWYLTALCTMADLDFGAVLAANIAKLKARYPAGWDAVKSQQRDVAAEAAL